MNFKTLYDLSAEKINMFSGDLPIYYYFFGSGIYLLFTHKYTKDPKKLLIGLGLTFISIIFLVIFLLGQFGDIDTAKQIIQSNKFLVVEGQPANYHPMPAEGHDTERFDINGIHFEYSDYHLGAAGYHNAAALGGVIVPNKYYRLTYYKSQDDRNSNRILKIEIQQ